MLRHILLGIKLNLRQAGERQLEARRRLAQKVYLHHFGLLLQEVDDLHSILAVVNRDDALQHGG